MRFIDLAALIGEQPGPVRLVAIDGPGGAGKSTFASRLSRALDAASVVHTDDFASTDNPVKWWPRLLEQVIQPLAAGRRARYQRFDWSTESLAEWIDVEPCPVVIIEGVSAGRSEWRHHLAFLIWIETPQAERLRRGLERDGADALDDWEAWVAEEELHFEADPTRWYVNLVVDGTGPMDAEAFTSLRGWAKAHPSANADWSKRPQKPQTRGGRLDMAHPMGSIMNHRRQEVPMSKFSPVFVELRQIMAPYVAKLHAVKDDETQLYLDTYHIQKNKKPLFFGAVQIKKAYVSFHLMPVYQNPKLLDSVSPELESHMQGKSCFNFRSVEPDLFEELSELTRASFEHYERQGFI
jgi:uridine kinase